MNQQIHLVLNNGEKQVLLITPSFLEAVRRAWRYADQKHPRFDVPHDKPTIRRGLAFGLIVDGNYGAATIVSTDRIRQVFGGRM